MKNWLPDTLILFGLPDSFEIIIEFSYLLAFNNAWGPFYLRTKFTAGDKTFQPSTNLGRFICAIEETMDCSWGGVFQRSMPLRLMQELD